MNFSPQEVLSAAVFFNTDVQITILFSQTNLYLSSWHKREGSCFSSLLHLAPRPLLEVTASSCLAKWLVWVLSYMGVARRVNINTKPIKLIPSHSGDDVTTRLHFQIKSPLQHNVFVTSWHCSRCARKQHHLSQLYTKQQAKLQFDFFILCHVVIMWNVSYCVFSFPSC